MLDPDGLDHQDPTMPGTCWDERVPMACDDSARGDSPVTLNVQRLRVTAEVDDLEEATFFYANVLGHSGMRVTPGRHDFDLGSEVLSILDPHADGGAASWPPDRHTLYVTTTDSLDDVRRRAASVGASLPVQKGGLSGEPWGTRALVVRDPWRNTVCIIERGASFRARRRVFTPIRQRAASQGY